MAMTEQQLDARMLAQAVETRPGVTLHGQLEIALRRLIESGRVSAGSILPGELELAAELHVSRHTVRHALGVLTNDGLLRRERGRGTTVASIIPTRIIERSLSTFYAFAWETRARGAEQRSYVLERTVLPADSEPAQRLQLEPGAEVERIVRLRTADEEPLVFETSYLPRHLASALDMSVLERGVIYDELERVHGLRITRARETIRPIVLQRPVARLLRARTGAPAFLVERTTWTESGPIEWQESIVRGDRYLYSIDLPRSS
jgi:GntR family transcriptional regulator, N-acetylglucosamine utilization regulator